MDAGDLDGGRRPDVTLPRAWKRVLFSALLVIGVCLFVEALAFVLFPMVEGEFFSYGRIREAQLRTAAEELPVADDGAADAWEPLEPQVVHPYLGYVFDPSAPSSSQDPRDTTSDWGFADWPRKPRLEDSTSNEEHSSSRASSLR